MSVFNPQTKEINCKIVYYGPALAGKTTSMLALQEILKKKAKGDIKKPFETERTLFFDFMALSSKQNIKGYKPKFQIYTVPGQVLYEDSRKLLLNGVDGIIFVADSRLEYIEETLRSFEEMNLNLKKLGYNPEDIPLVIQYNKRDCATAARVEDLRSVINKRAVPDGESIASKGKGVFESFETILRHVMMALKEE